ncbi:MAG: ABC transporter permease [Lachnospiraceae bacterium]|jgi:simple sugar transport system permease protein|nr:ABC transporter permease [Lachnospiraceae bacterium]MCI9135350.1 ABC transporter permease [Lachnospiraceae bacterium]
MNKNLGKRLLAEGGVVIAIVIAFVFFSIMAPRAFLSFDNVINILKSISITTVIAMGATIGFAAGIFDLSFASLATLGAALSCTFIAWYNMPMPIAMIATILVCMLVELVNSVLVVKFQVTAFLATLAMSFVVDGLVLTYSGGSLINPRMASASGQEVVREIPQAFWNMGKSPYIIIIMFLCILVVELFLTYTKHGRLLYMVGSNAGAARLSGVKIGMYTTMAFMLTAVFSSLAGMLIAARAGTVQSTAGSSFLMPAIAAANIGFSFGGRGKANAIGTFVGAALIGVVENGLYAMAFPYYSINIIKGIILILALVLSTLSAKAQENK